MSKITAGNDSADDIADADEALFCQDETPSSLEPSASDVSSPVDHRKSQSIHSLKDIHEPGRQPEVRMPGLDSYFENKKLGEQCFWVKKHLIVILDVLARFE